MPLTRVGQVDFSAGAHVGWEDVPDRGVEDAVDALIDDDGSLYRRGGSAYKSTSDAADTLGFLWDGYLVPGQRTVFATPGKRLYVLDTNDVSPLLVCTFPSAGQDVQPRRPASVRGVLFMLYDTSPFAVAYGGSRKTASYSTGTASVTNGSKTVTGAGTSWSANVDAGMLLRTTGQAEGVVEQVVSNTQLTLRDEWGGTTAAGSGYALEVAAIPPISALSAATAVASIEDRLVIAWKNRVLFTSAGNPFVHDATDYHDLPEGVQILGMETVGDVLVVFASSGVFAVTNMAYDLTDAFGNQQQHVQAVGEGVLWSNNGVTRYQGAVIAPCTHDIVIMAANGEERPIGGGIRRLYRSYVESGYTAGFAAVYRGHYWLPILNGTTWVDTLVCKLDTGAWTRMAGHAGSAVHMAVRAPTSSTPPKLFGAKGLRVIDNSAVFAPTAATKNDADGTTPQLKVTTRSYMLSEVHASRTKWFRIRYELDDAASDDPTWTAEYATGRPGSSFTAMTGTGAEGESSKRFYQAKTAQQIRARFSTNNAALKAILRAVEWTAVPPGRT